MNIIEALNNRRPIPPGRESRLSLSLLSTDDYLTLDRLLDQDGDGRARLANSHRESLH